MRKLMLLAAAVCGALLLTGNAMAGAPLTTAPLIVSSGAGAGIFCEIVNVGTTPLEVIVETIRDDGVQGNVCGPVPALDPGKVLSCGGSVNSDHAYYCRFTGGSKKRVRASIVAWSDNGAGELVPTAALPAQ